MISESELRHRQWPDAAKDVAFSMDLYVTEGSLFNRALQMAQDMSEPIPPGECAITSLTAAADGRVFGATSGERAHVFCYSTPAGGDSVMDMGVVPGAAAVRSCLVVGADGQYLGGVSETLDSRSDGCLFCQAGDKRKRGTVPKRRKEAFPKWPEVELLPAPVKGECVAAMAVDRRRNVAYGLSTKTATLFAVRLDTLEVSIKGRATQDKNFSHYLVLDRRGKVYGTGPLGRLFRYDPELDQIDTPPVSLPTLAGREFYNRLDAAALDPVTGLIYGGTSADGILFAFDPEGVTMRSLGKVIAEPRCRAITVGRDGRVYGVAGESDGMGHMFCYDPRAHDLRDLGVPFATTERTWHGYEFGAACTGRNGEIYLGECDRISHLFIYFPPIRPPEPMP